RVDRREAGELLAVERCGRLVVGRRCHAGVRWPAVVGSHHRAGVDMSWAALLLAVALLIGGDSRSWMRLRAAEPRHGRSTPSGRNDPLASASRLYHDAPGRAGG